jgi:hypothetical protein
MTLDISRGVCTTGGAFWASAQRRLRARVAVKARILVKATIVEKGVEREA